MQRLKYIFNTDARTSLLRKNILFSFLIKGWSGLVMLLLVPITLSCLGEYDNGVWLTISSTLIWIDNLDVGLGNGLRNKLAAAVAREDYAEGRKVVSNTFFMLLAIIIPAISVIMGLLQYVDMYSFLNVDEAKVGNLDDIICVSFLFVCGAFVFKFIGNFYMGLQLPAVSNLLVTCGHTLTLLLTYLAYYAGFRSLMCIAVINTASPLLVYVLTYPYTFFHKYRVFCPSLSLFSFSTAKSLFTTSLKFFVLQIAGVVLFMTSTILISKIFSPAEVTPYQIVYRYFTIVVLVFTIVSMPYWNATTDAYERGDIEWIRKSQRGITKILCGLFVLTLLMVVVSPVVFYIWLDDKIDIPFMLVLIVAIYVFVTILSLSYSYFLNGMGILRMQMILTVSAAVVYVPLAYYVTNLWHTIYSIILLMTVLILPNLVCNAIQFYKVVNGTAKGIWIK